MIYKRIIDIKKHIELQKVLIIYGPRQVGKTTLLKKFLNQYKGKQLFFTGDDLEFSNEFSQCNLSYVKKMFSGIDLLAIDEAQLIPSIGRALKLVIDNIPGISVIVTGSSAFNLANKTAESLTGRKNVITLYPLTQLEILDNKGQYLAEKELESILRFGSYPEILSQETYQLKEKKIREITNSYLLKDILQFDLVKGSKLIVDLLKLIAFQVGSEVSLNELGRQLGIDKKTVGRYLDLLEKSFVLFRLDGFSRNLRKEVSKMSKYYFYDLGIRNSLIANFNDLGTRNDQGQLWENFILIERIKKNSYINLAVNYYFWRTYDQKEIDLIEERNGNLFGYEFKWKAKKTHPPKDWLDTYDNSSYEEINTGNYFEFVT